MLENVRKTLEDYEQSHLLRFYDELTAEEKKHLLEQINNIDFELMASLFKNINNKKEIGEITSIPSYSVKDEYQKVGQDIMKHSEYAVITMAGGQGTRLGYDGPKGTYTLEYGINKSLFEIHCDKLKHIYSMTGIYTPWYIMTSGTNNEDTINFFEEHNYFDYPKDMISFFVQDELPMIDTEGKIIMDSKFNIKMGPNGHGGVLSSLFRSGMLDKMKKSHIKWVFIGGVDNILTPYDGTELVGFAKSGNYPVVSYIIDKSYPEEKVGVFCKIDDRPSVIEYINMTPEMNNKKDDKGNLLYGSAHLLLNLFSIEALEIISRRDLDYVPAFKKADYLDEEGKVITPLKENAYKFETFIFDVFPYFSEIGLLKGRRENIFAPIKNATGVDSPETASKLYLEYYENKQ